MHDLHERLHDDFVEAGQQGRLGNEAGEVQKLSKQALRLKALAVESPYLCSGWVRFRCRRRCDWL